MTPRPGPAHLRAQNEQTRRDREAVEAEYASFRAETRARVGLTVYAEIRDAVRQSAQDREEQAKRSRESAGALAMLARSPALVRQLSTPQ